MAEQQGLEKAQENLLYIRQTMQAATQLTVVPGSALVAIGVLALAGAAVNGFITGAPWNPETDARYPLLTWGIVQALSMTTVLVEMYRKSLRMREPIHPPLLRRLLWCLCPSLFVGALLTGLAIHNNGMEWLPVIWLGCYGAAVTNGGMVSVPPIRYMGLCFLLAAGCAAVSLPEAGLVWLALGFGGLHIGFGGYIARRHND